MQNKKVHARLFKETEQFDLIYLNLLNSAGYKGSECLEKLVEMGFNIEAKMITKGVKFFLSTFLDHTWDYKDIINLTQALDAYNKTFNKQMVRLGLVLK